MPAVIILAATLVAGAIVAAKKFPRLSSKPQGFVYQCTPQAPSSIECFQQKYKDMVISKGLKPTFDQLRVDYAKDPSVVASCHQITHAIGREAAAELKTVEASFSQGDNICWSGYYHGVMEEIASSIGTAKINTTFTSVCNKAAAENRYSFYHYNCVHGLGHGLMAVNQDELFRVLDLCQNYTDNWEKQSCYSGAFMENIMSALQAGNQSKYLKDDDPLYPCTVVKQIYKQQCYLMQTSQALKVLGQDYDKVFALCATTGEFQNTCNQSLGRDASGGSSSNPQRTSELCMKGQDQAAREHCIIGAVKDFISYFHSDTQAAELCSILDNALQPVCNDTKVSYYKTL